MQISDVRPESFTKQIRCDRCGRLAELGEVEFHESISIESKAGYGSIFGDGNDVQVDLCQHCLKTTLGPWLRVSNLDERRALLEERLRLFDQHRHGGEFPTDRDIALQVPDDMPVQERPSLDGDLQVQPIGLVGAPEGRHAHSAQLWPLIRHFALLFFAPLTGAIRGIRREYKRLNCAERSRQRDQPEYLRRVQAAIDRSKAVGDGVPADFVLAKLRAMLISAQAGQGSFAKGTSEMRAGPSLTRDYTVTVSERMQNDPLFAEAMLDEAIALAANGLSEPAKQILLDLFNAGQALPASKADG